MALILCIDDEPVLLRIYAAVLESSGYKVLTALDGPSGIALAQVHPVDAVVSDFNMPGMDGNQVAQVLKAERPTLPVLIWSGCVEEIPTSRKLFADLLLNKADGPEVLLPTIRTVLKDSGKRFRPLLCCLCGKPVPVETANTDDGGNAIHEDCYILKLEHERARNDGTRVNIVPR